MKMLLLGKGVANNGCKRLLDKHHISYDYLNIDELSNFDYDYIVKSPGITLHDEVFKMLKGKIISDIELAYILEKPYIIGVTGSNGKTSVASMLGHILSYKYNVCVCGNIGYSVCDALVDKNADMYIVELSSFQLETVSNLDCNISIITNISLCHLDHHLSMNKYVNAKLNICKYQDYSHYTIYNLDNPYLKDISKITMCKAIGFSFDSSITRVYVLNEYIYYKNKRIYKLSKNELAYRHKIENYLAVLTAVSLLDFNMKKAAKLLRKFKDVEFRLNKISDYIYNDAKSTNCASTNAALSALDNVHLICGGYSRGIEIYLDKSNLEKIKYVYAYGESKYEVKFYFENLGIKCFIFETLEEAFRSAYIKRDGTENILYSPMFASYDQYSSYKERGNEFNNVYFKLTKK
ncbi:MAG: UDP-N-acetylmuramoyl-L-alanine--D-glutamate ligase [Erysipelotrichaceae bacterium]|nr:UDP-N-acetylmuramoyl-L-alanine--D-glutamate ligase [Erysipelotrichaceae bacterium]